MYAVEVKNLRKGYFHKGKKIEAVKGISFKIKEGEIYGFLGPNGAGKSTTINILSGTLSKDSGSARILGRDIEKDMEYVKNNINVASAYYSLPNILTIYENLKVFAKFYNIRNYKEKIDSLLEMFDLKGIKSKRTVALSTGERTRVSLCKGLINNPKVLLLDECTVGLDPDVAEKTRSIIKDYQKNSKVSILFTSHYMYEVEELCSNISFLSEGRILKTDTAANLKKLIKNYRVEIDFIKSNKMLREFFSEKGLDVFFLGRNTVVFELSAKEDRLYRILNSLFKRGFKVRDLRIKRPTLDDIFIKISRGSVK